MPMVFYSRVETALGELLLTSTGAKLTGLYFADQPHGQIAPHWHRNEDLALFAETQRQLEEFAAGERTSFDLDLLAQGTPFQMLVWKEISRIPFGKTTTYSALAQRIGKPDSVRAVGTAAGANPLCLVVPCHRVVGKDGSLTGFAGGLERKQALLEFESARLAGSDAPLQMPGQLVAA